MFINLSSIKEMDFFGREAYKTLRTNVQFLGADYKVIAFTSCAPNEGKSRVTFNLARALAEDGKKVLLIDADLRKSVMIGRYKISRGAKGLSHYLSRIAPVEDVLAHTNVDKLDMVIAGPVPPNPSELLGNKMMEELVEIARKNYDYVLIDTPPLGSVIDTAVVARFCDGVILVIDTTDNNYRFEQKIVGQIEKTGCPLLGVILNKVRFGEKKGYYGNYYGKYYGKYYGHEGDKKSGTGKNGARPVKDASKTGKAPAKDVRDVKGKDAVVTKSATDSKATSDAKVKSQK